MLLQTNSYVVPADKRADHDRMMRRFRQIMTRLGCDDFDVVEQTGPNWSGGEPTGRFVQIMRFRDRKQQLAGSAANDHAHLTESVRTLHRIEERRDRRIHSFRRAVRARELSHLIAVRGVELHGCEASVRR